MSGNRSFSDLVRGVGQNTLDLPVAALAALATAFAAFAVPPDVLAELVGRTGLPSFVPAAEPPLGNTARISLSVAGAIFVFVSIFGLLRWLDRKPKPAGGARVEAPRVRRRDYHPDAPAPRPISAALEFGEPANAKSPEADMPAWLAPAEFVGEYVDQASEPSGVREELAQAEPEPVLEKPRTLDRQALKSIDDPKRPTARVAQPGTETIADLMLRLEQGLAKRQPASEPVPRSPDIEPAPKPSSEPAMKMGADDDRLQSAIDSLQRFASRQG